MKKIKYITLDGHKLPIPPNCLWFKGNHFCMAYENEKLDESEVDYDVIVGVAYLYWEMYINRHDCDVEEFTKLHKFPMAWYNFAVERNY